MSSLTHILRHGIIAASANKEEYDPYWDYVVLLLKGNGDTTQSPSTATFKDYSKYSRVPANPSNVCLVSQGRFHEGIGMVDPSATTNTILQFTGGTAFYLNTDYTFEFFMKVTAPSAGYFMGFSAAVYFSASSRDTSRPTITSYNFGTNGSTTLTPIDTFDKWYHIAACKQGSTGYIFVDGTLVNSGKLAESASTLLNLFGISGRTDLSTVTNTQFDELRFTKGICRYLSNFAPPTREFPTKGKSYVYTSRIDTDFLCHFEGESNYLIFTDETGKNISVSGASLGYVNDSKFGQSSFRVLATGNYIRYYPSRWFSEHSAFTIECWVKPLESTQNSGIYYLSPVNNPNINGLGILLVNAARNLQVTYNESIQGTSTLSVPPNEWSHVAVSFLDNYLYVSVNGVVEKIPTNIPNITSGSNMQLNIGTLYAGTSRMIGYIDEFRVTSRFALYTQNFTPPTQPFTF